MKILIKSRSAIERLAQKPFPKNTLLISITDVGDVPVQLTNEPDILLRVAFDDVDNDVIVDEVGADATNEQRLKIEEKYNMISSDQAHEIAKVYYENKDRITTLIYQCEHGQSRSAAVASAILEFKRRRGIQIFADDRYYPNKVVFRRVLEALKDQIPVYEYS
jgi:predicted protein tyrosine phosphatase